MVRCSVNNDSRIRVGRCRVLHVARFDPSPAHCLFEIKVKRTYPGFAGDFLIFEYDTFFSRPILSVRVWLFAENSHGRH